MIPDALSILFIVFVLSLLIGFADSTPREPGLRFE
jgi:hypothetical protein